MEISSFFLQNYVMLFELIGLLIIRSLSVHISKDMKRITLIVVCLLFAETAIFHLEKWTQTFEQLSLARPFLTATVYSLYPVILFFLMQLVTTKKLTEKHVLLLLIPEIICVPLFYTSQWTHLVCYFDKTNHYHGGPLSWLPYILFAVYVLILLIYNFYYFKNNPGKARLVIFYIVLGPILGVILYIVNDAQLDFSALFTSAIVLYYIYLYIFLSKIDPLTALLNRQSYYHDIEADDGSITGVVSIDMNDLKYFNDRMGHTAGDKALFTVAAAFRNHCGRGRVYRVGGDEFMIFYSNTKEQEIVKAIEAMREELSQTPYSCAFGYAMREPNRSVFETIRVSDQKMYENKAEMKKEQAAGKPEQNA